MEDYLVYAATICVGVATGLAAIIVALLYTSRRVPRALALGDAAFAVVGLVLHGIAQVDAHVGGDFVIAIPFLVLGAVSGVVLAARRLRGHRPVRRLTVVHTGMLLVALVLAVQGVTQELGEGPSGMAQPFQEE